MKNKFIKYIIVEKTFIEWLQYLKRRKRAIKIIPKHNCGKGKTAYLK